MIMTQGRVDEIHALKEEICWSWNTVANKFGWTPHHLSQIRALKAPIADLQIAWLTSIRDAITAIPAPDPGVALSPPAPEFQQPQDIKVMMLDDIAEKLADEYLKIDPTATADEIAGARYMVGRLAERLGVAEEVRELIRRGTPAPLPAVEERPFLGLSPHRLPGRDHLTPLNPLFGDEAPPTARPTVGNPFAMRARERMPMED